MSSELFLDEERIVAGTPEMPAACSYCTEYRKVFNVCQNCGRDERVRFGCKHRIGLGDLCAECRESEILEEREVEQAEKATEWATYAKRLEGLVVDFCGLKLMNNREELLALQVRAMDLLSRSTLS